MQNLLLYLDGDLPLINILEFKVCLFVCLFVHRLVYVDCGYLPNRDISWPTAISRRAHRLCHAAVYWYLWRNIRLFPGQSAMYKEPAIILQDIHCRALASLCCTYWDRSAIFSKLYQARVPGQVTIVSFINACIHSTCLAIWLSLLYGVQDLTEWTRLQSI